MSDRTSGSKRKAMATAAGNRNVAAVAHALENAARIGATFATQRSDAFAAPAIALKGGDDNGDEEDLATLPLPLRKRDAVEIKTRGVAAQHRDGKPVAWEVDGEGLASPNPKWHAFLDKFVKTKRYALGIGHTATVQVTLNRLVLAEPGARLLMPVKVERARADGAFARLLVVLPGSFEGGDVVVENNYPLHDDQDWECMEDEDIVHEDKYDGTAAVWRHGEPGDVFELVCAAFHDCCEFEAKEIESGTALYLVYDLVTTTAPTQIRLYGGTEAVQRGVDDALTTYFDVAPPQLAKRLKISPDAWRSIHDFAAERSYAYLVIARNAEDQSGPEGRVAKSLEAFCAHSEGQYVLYVSSVLCSRLEKTCSENLDSSDDDSVEAGCSCADNHAMETRVTLTAPWVKVGEPDTELSCPAIFLNDHELDTTSLDLLELIDFRFNSRGKTSDAHKSALQELYGDQKYSMSGTLHALVVMPASVERRQIAKLPITDALLRVNSLLAKSRVEALEYARRVIHYRPEWSIPYDEVELLEAFVHLVVKINDRSLFEELLLTLELEIADDERLLWRAIEHFGFDACVGAIERRIRSTSTVRGRVHLVLAAIDESLDSPRIEKLLDVLLSLHPWTDVQAKPSHMGATKSNDLPRVETVRGLLDCANELCPQKALQVASVKDPEAMVRMVLPASLPLSIFTHPTMPLLRDVLAHAYELFKVMRPEIHNHAFAKIQPAKHCTKHCAKCDELQAFLNSTATETTIQYTDQDELTHIRAILDRIAGESAYVRARDPSGTSVRLTKVLRERFSLFRPQALHAAAKDVEKKVLEALAPPVEAREQDAPGEAFSFP